MRLTRAPRCGCDDATADGRITKAAAIVQQGVAVRGLDQDGQAMPDRQKSASRVGFTPTIPASHQPGTNQAAMRHHRHAIEPFAGFSLSDRPTSSKPEWPPQLARKRQAPIARKGRRQSGDLTAAQPPRGRSPGSNAITSPRPTPAVPRAGPRAPTRPVRAPPATWPPR